MPAGWDIHTLQHVAMLLFSEQEAQSWFRCACHGYAQTLYDEMPMLVWC